MRIKKRSWSFKTCSFLPKFNILSKTKDGCGQLLKFSLGLHKAILFKSMCFLFFFLPPHEFVTMFRPLKTHLLSIENNNYNRCCFRAFCIQGHQKHKPQLISENETPMKFKGRTSLIQNVQILLACAEKQMCCVCVCVRVLYNWWFLLTRQALDQTFEPTWKPPRRWKLKVWTHGT